MRKLTRPFIRFLVPAAVVLAVWQVTALGVELIRGVTFPGPWQTGARLFDLLSGEAFLDASLYTHALDSRRRRLHRDDGRSHR